MYNYKAGVYIDENIKVVNKNLTRKLYLYDNFYEDNSQICTLFNLDSDNCKNNNINELKNSLEHILNKKINTLQSNIIKLTEDHIINPENNEWIAVVFLNPNNSVDNGNGLAFMQENFNSNNKINNTNTNSTKLIVEDFFYGKSNRIIIFNSKYYHKLIVKIPILVEIIHVKLI